MTNDVTPGKIKEINNMYDIMNSMCLQVTGNGSNDTSMCGILEGFEQGEAIVFASGFQQCSLY